VSVTLDATIPEGEFTRYHMGVNLPDYTSRDLVRTKGADLIKEAGFKFIRFPGGSPADAYLWDNSYDKYPFFKQFRGDYDNGIRTDDIIDLCNKTGAEPLIQINYAMFVLYGQDAGADLAVRWYQYFKARGIVVKYWELGNENSGGWEVPQSSKDCKGFDGPPSTCQNANGEHYGQALAYLASAMRKIDPEVKIGAWLETNEREDGAGQRKAKWDSLLMPQLRAQNWSADWLNIHTYFWQPMDWSQGKYTPYSPRDLYSHDQRLLTKTKLDFEAIVQKYYAEGLSMPVAITEWNIDQAFPHADPQVDEHISGLVTADLIGQAVSKGGVQALNYFALLDGWKTDACDKPPCPGPADLGMISSGQPGVPDGTPRPAWFSFAMWGRSMGNQIIRSEFSGADGVTTYASRFSSGEMGLIVINTKSDDLTLRISGIPHDAALRGWVLTPSDAAASPLDYARGSAWNGEGPASGNIGGPLPITDIKPYGATATGDSVEVFVPKVALVGVVFYQPSQGHALVI
jgi:hypothetical protein